ncbi:MAG: hypothetical protein LUB59_07200 [Candidatus Gastranaerophilales bacterium]|nr:hypothetical protein [Candidatus Gastranaerophilales bacterium]
MPVGIAVLLKIFTVDAVSKSNTIIVLLLKGISVGLSIEEKVQAYIDRHPKFRNKPLDEVITVMLQDGSLSGVEFEEDEKYSIFGTKNKDKIGDGLEIKNKKHKQKTETVKNQSAETAQKTKEEMTLAEVIGSRHKSVSDNLQKTEKNNGFFGKIWSGFKNLTGIGDSSNKVKKAQKHEQELIAQLDGVNKSKAFEELTGVEYSKENEEKFRNGEIKLESETALEGYTEGQEMAADVGGDIVSGIAAVGVYSLLIAAAPVTGGASVILGFGAAAAAGAMVKSGVKALDAAVGGRKYTSFGHDIVTGGFSGMLAPFTGGLGGAAGRSAAKVLGLQAVKFAGKETAEETIKTGFKSGFKRALLNPTGYKYTGGSILKKTGAYATEAAADGALGGGIDTAFRTAYDGGSASDTANAAVQGTLGGLLLGPLMSLGFKGLGKLGHFGGKKIKNSSSQSSVAAKKTGAGTKTEEVRTKTKAGETAEMQADAPAAASQGNKRPDIGEIKDRFNIRDVLNETQLKKTSSQLIIIKDGKKVLTDEGDNLIKKTAAKINEISKQNEAGIIEIMKEMGLTTDKTNSHRSKGGQSLYDKIKNKLLTSDTMTLEKAIDSVWDGVGVRTVDPIQNFASHPGVKKYIDTGDMKTALQKAVELESDYVFKGLMKYIDSAAEGTNKVKLTRISNYMGEDGIPYFTEKQLKQLKMYAASKKVDLPVIERVANPFEAEAVKTTKKAKSTTQVRGSGYTALQMNFETKNGFIYEWQYRGSKLNNFAEGEHIPYDLRTNKDIIGTHAELTRLYQPMKELLSNKTKITDEMYEEYNHYLTAHYEYLRLAELGFNDGLNPPKLPDGFDARLRAENLELLHEIAEKIKKNPEKETELLSEYNSRLVHNTTENTTANSYTLAARQRQQNKVIDRYEAGVRLGEIREGQENIGKQYSSLLIKACRDESGQIKDSLVRVAEKLQQMGGDDLSIANFIKKVKKGNTDEAIAAIDNLKQAYPEFNSKTIAGILEISADNNGIIDKVKVKKVSKFFNEAGVDIDVIKKVYEKTEKSSTNSIKIQNAMKEIFAEFNSNKIGTMKNTMSLNSIIEQCFDRSGKLDNNAVAISKKLLSIRSDFSEIETIIQLAKDTETGAVPPNYISFITKIIDNSDVNNYRANTVSHVLTGVTNFLRVFKKDSSGKWQTSISQESVDFFKKALTELKSPDNTDFQTLQKTAIILNSCRTYDGIGNPAFKDYYFYAKQLHNRFKYTPNAIKEVMSHARKFKNPDDVIKKIHSTISQIIPANEHRNITGIDIKIEAGVIKRRLTYKDGTTKIVDFDMKTMGQIGTSDIQKSERHGRNIVVQNDTKRGQQTIVKTRAKENQTTIQPSKTKKYGSKEETIIIRDPNTGETTGIEYLRDSDVPGVFNIQFRDETNGGKTKLLSSAQRDKSGNTLIEKNFQSLDGTETNYWYTETKDGNYHSTYKITDTDGNVLLDETRVLNKIDEQHYEYSYNGKQYFTEIDENNILTVTDNTGRTVRFDLDEFSLNNMNNSNFVELFKRIPPHEFFHMKQTNTGSIGVQNIKYNAHYMPGTNIIELGEGEQVLSTLLHEYGHNKDWRLVDKQHILRDNPEFLAVYNNERETFVKSFANTQRDYVSYFIDLDKIGGRKNQGAAETIAEANMLTGAPSGLRVMRAYYLQRYFPKTIAYITKHINPEIYNQTW